MAEQLGKAGTITDSKDRLENPEHRDTLKTQPVDIYIMRHGKEDKSTGELTEEGIEATQEAAKQIAERSLADGEPTVFFVLASPTRRINLGQRAMHSGRVVVDAIKSVSNAKGLDQEQVKVHVFGDRDEETRPTRHLSVPTYSFDPKVEEHIIHELQDDWDRAEESFLNMDDPAMEQLIEEAGERNAAAEADRVARFLRIIERYSSLYGSVNPEVRQVYIMATHGDLLRATVQHGLGVGEEASGYVFANSEPVHISLADGKAETEFKGTYYQTELV
jgi:broad specificity phosphatase PhoE